MPAATRVSRPVAGHAPPARPDESVEPQLAGEIKRLLVRGDVAAARRRFADLVERHQRRASRLAFHYLRDAADADEAVQDAFVKVFGSLTTYREEVPFQAWFTKILVNGCLDRIKARKRRSRWITSMPESSGPDGYGGLEMAAADVESPEQRVLRHERRSALHEALERLPDRQRAVVVLSQLDGRSAREIGSILGTTEATVRVHLFRGLRRLRTLLTPAGLMH
jgi:RNA polymerase sigma-70 factor (ECF subfamily)